MSLNICVFPDELGPATTMSPRGVIVGAVGTQMDFSMLKSVSAVMLKGWRCRRGGSSAYRTDGGAAGPTTGCAQACLKSPTSEGLGCSADEVILARTYSSSPLNVYEPLVPLIVRSTLPMSSL